MKQIPKTADVSLLLLSQREYRYQVGTMSKINNLPADGIFSNYLTWNTTISIINYVSAQTTLYKANIYIKVFFLCISKKVELLYILMYSKF